MDEELFQRMQEAAERFKSGESDFEEIMTPNGPAHIVRDAADPRGFRIDFVGGGASHTVPLQKYPASRTRPPGYPAPLPFLANAPATVDTSDQSVTWEFPADPARCMEQLHGQSVEDGWKVLTWEAERSVFEKDDVERTLLLASGGEGTRIVLRERPIPTSPTP